MDMKLCSECMNRSIIMMKSKTGKEYREYFCSVSGTRLKFTKECPMSYDLQEYEKLIAKGEAYDQLRYRKEIEAAT